MKKKFKYFLLGAGTVVAGFFAYAWLKDQPKTRPVDDIIGEPSADTIPQGASAEQNVSQEYIEHRRELYRKRAAQRAASPAVAEDSSASPVVACETPAARPEIAQRIMALPHSTATGRFHSGAPPCAGTGRLPPSAPAGSLAAPPFRPSAPRYDPPRPRCASDGR